MEYITLQNPYSIYQIYKYEYGRKFLNSFLNSKLNTNEEYILLDYYNQEFNDVRSYIIFESKNNVVLLDFKYKKEYQNEIFTFLKKTSVKKCNLVLIDNNNKDNSIWFAASKEKQTKCDKKLTNILYMMNKYLIELYNHEEYLKNKFDN